MKKMPESASGSSSAMTPYATQESEIHILAEIKAGDTEKFGLLYDAYFPRIYNYLFYRVREKETAEDIASATFFKAIEKLHTFDPHKGNFSAWIYRIARNTLYDHFRSPGNSRNSPLEHAEFIHGTDNVEGAAMDRELVKRVNACISQLPERQREIIGMRLWDDLSYAEIAEVLGKSEASCKMEFSRALRKIRETAPLAAIMILLVGSRMVK